MYLKFIIIIVMFFFLKDAVGGDDDRFICDKKFVNKFEQDAESLDIILELKTNEDKWSFIPIEKDGIKCFTFKAKSFDTGLFVSLANKKGDKYGKILFAKIQHAQSTGFRIYDYNEDDDVVETSSDYYLQTYDYRTYWVDWTNNIFRLGIVNSTTDSSEEIEEIEKPDNKTIMEYEFESKLEITDVGLKTDVGRGVEIVILKSKQECPGLITINKAPSFKCEALNITSPESNLEIILEKQKIISKEIESESEILKSFGEEVSKYVVKSVMLNLVKLYEDAEKLHKEFEILETSKEKSDIFQEIKLQYYNLMNDLGNYIDGNPEIGKFSEILNPTVCKN